MADKNRWAIIDNTGTIHDGTEEEMRTAFDTMVNTFIKPTLNEKRLIEKWTTEWKGDLKLIEIHGIYR